MLERAQARKLIGVHKAAEGSWRHAETAATALSEATLCLNRHHGSSAGWGMPESWRDMALRLERGDQSWSQGGSGKDAGGKGSAAKGKSKGKGKGDKGKGSENAKAKGKGKSADKGKGAGGWWPCPEPGCEKLMGKVWWSPPSICQCPQCHTYRAEAPDIWEEQRAKLRTKVAKEAGVAAAAPAAAAAGAQDGESASGDTPMFSDDEDEDLGPPAARANLTEEYQGLHKQLLAPMELKESWSAEEVMAAHTNDPGAAKIQQQIQECKKFLSMEALAGSFASDVDFGPAKKKLEALEKSAARTMKSAPGAALNACQLATARQEFSDAEDAKRLVSRKGAVKASERMARMEVICEEQVDAWQRQLKDLQESEVKRAAKWEERRKLLDSRGAEVLQLFVDKIRAAKTLAGEIANVGGASGSGAAASAEPPKTAAKPDAAAIAKKVKEDAAAEALKEALKVTEAAFVILNKTVQFTNALPALMEKPPADTVPVMARMFYWARASTCGEANLPFTLVQMGATPDVACSLVGRDIWDLFFGKDGGNAKDTILPMQLRYLVFQQLMRYEAKLAGTDSCFIAEHQSQEQKAVDALKAACPRLLEQRDQLKRSNPY